MIAIVIILIIIITNTIIIIIIIIIYVIRYISIIYILTMIVGLKLFKLGVPLPARWRVSMLGRGQILAVDQFGNVDMVIITPPIYQIRLNKKGPQNKRGFRLI